MSNETPIELDVLAVFSHPDDAELSVAGTMLKLKHLGYRTGILDLTRGEMGTRGTPQGRAVEAQNAAKLLKVDVRLNLDQPDGHVQLNDAARVAFVRIVRQYKPKLILTAPIDDPHPDHANTASIVREASRLASMWRYDEDFGLAQVPMPRIAHSIFSRLVPPSFIVDVSDFYESKMAAIRAHESQFFRANSAEPATRISDEGFLQQIEWRMRYFGSLINVKAGEPFYVREALNVEDPLALLNRPMNIYS